MDYCEIFPMTQRFDTDFSSFVSLLCEDRRPGAQWSCWNADRLIKAAVQDRGGCTSKGSPGVGKGGSGAWSPDRGVRVIPPHDHSTSATPANDYSASQPPRRAIISSHHHSLTWPPRLTATCVCMWVYVRKRLFVQARVDE